MGRSFVRLALFVLSFPACGAEAPAASKRAGSNAAGKQPAAAATAGDAAKSVDAAEPADDPAAKLAEMGAQLQELREIAQAYSAGSLGERLAVGEMLLVDAKAPADTDEVQFIVINGALAARPATLSALRATKASDGSSVRQYLHGGEDASRPGLFYDIGPGTYTACAVVGPPKSDAKKAYLAEAEAAYKAENGEKLDGAKLMAVAAKAQAKTGYKPEEIDWDRHPVRCKQVDVTAVAASRVVVLDAE